MSLQGRVYNLVKRTVPDAFPVQILIPEDGAFGHFSTNIAFLLGKAKGMNPVAQAEEIVAEIWKIAPEGFFEKIEVKSPGFINFFLSPKSFQEELRAILKAKSKYGRGAKKKERIQIEFVSANPTGPLTLGNGRGGFLGDTLGNVLDYSGYRVVREYYVNDIGRQIRILGASILFSSGAAEAKLFSLVPELMHMDRGELYRGDYIETLAKGFSAAFSGMKRDAFLKRKGISGVGSWASDRLLGDIKKVIRSLGIRFDSWFRESSLYAHGAKKKSLAERVYLFLEERGFLAEKEGAIWFLASQLGDERDRVVRRSKKDGEKTAFDTYFFSDIAYHWDKFKKRKFDKAINIWGADHYGHIKSVQAALRAIGVEQEKLTFLIVQLVRLVRGGEEVRMSKRKGEYVTLKELVDEVGLDAARFFFLMNAANSHMTFDLALAKERSLKNPVYYVQYTAVRAQSILKKASARLTKNVEKGLRRPDALEYLNTKEDTELIRTLSRFPEVVEETARDYEAQRLVRYAIELSQIFNSFYEKERIIGEEERLASARLALVFAALTVFRNLFGILGISIPKKM